MQPLRRWLWLVMAAIVAVPAATLPIVAAIRAPLPPYLDVRVVDVVDPALRNEIVAAVDRWQDPAWQASVAPRLADAGLAATFLDPAGALIYQSPDPSEAVPAGSATPNEGAAWRPVRPGAEVVVSTGGVVRGTARLQATSAPLPLPLPIRSDLVGLWLFPASQLLALLLIALAATWFVHRALVSPLGVLAEGARRIAAGDLDVALPASRATEVDALARSFGAMSAELRAGRGRQAVLEQERRTTVAALVHDLRTPLFALRGYLDGLAAGLADSPEKVARYLRVCREKADALERLLGELTDFTQTERLDGGGAPEPLELGEVLTGAAEGFVPQAAAKGVRLLLRPPAGPTPIAGDAHLLGRAVGNLLDNAVRHAPDGGTVTLAWGRSEAGADFTVADDGPGFADADLPHLFSPFFRGEASRNRSTGGTGLGLTIARRVVRAHGGELTAGNAPGGGAVLRGTLPPADASAASAAAVGAAPRPASTAAPP